MIHWHPAHLPVVLAFVKKILPLKRAKLLVAFASECDGSTAGLRLCDDGHVHLDVMCDARYGAVLLCTLHAYAVALAREDIGFNERPTAEQVLAASARIAEVLVEHHEPTAIAFLGYARSTGHAMMSNYNNESPEPLLNAIGSCGGKPN